MATFLPPVLLEIKAKASEAYKELAHFQAATKAALVETAAQAEAAAVAAEAKADKASARAMRMMEKATREAGEAGMAAAHAAALAEEEARVAAVTAAEARATAVAASEAVGVTATASSTALLGLQRVGKAALLGTAAAMAIVGYEGVKMGGDFQQAVRLLQTGAGESEHNLKMVSDGILHMAGQVGTSSEELANGMYLIESAGYHGADGLKVLQAAAEGAKTDGAELKVVGDALTTVMKDMHAPAADSAAIMSQMVAAVGAGKMRMDDFAGSIHSVLPNAAALHIKFADVAGALATMTAQGMSAQQASQNLNHAIVKLAAPTAKMTSTMASYGLSASDVAAHLGERGLSGTLEMVTKAITDHMGPAGLTLRSAFEQSKEAAASADAALKAMPPSLQALATAYKNGGITVGGWRAQLKNLPADQAALAGQWKQMEDRAHGFSAALRSGSPAAQTFTAALKDMLGDQTSLQVALHLTGEATEDYHHAIEHISAAAPEAGGHVKDWAEVTKNFNLQVAQVKDSIGAWVTMIGLHLIPILSAAITFAQHHGTTMKVIAAIIGGVLVIAIGAYTVAMAEAAIATIAATWPILLIIAAVVALVVAIWYVWRHWSQIWGWIKEHTASVWGWISNAASVVGHALKTAWDATMHAVSAVIRVAWTVIKTIFHAWWQTMIPLRIAVHLLAATVKVAFAAIRAVIRLWWQLTKLEFGLFRQYILGPIIGVIKDLWHIFVFTFDAIKAQVKAWWATIRPVLAAVIHTGMVPIKAAVKGLQSAWHTAWGAIKGVLSGAWQVIRGILGHITGAIDHVMGTINGLIGKIDAAGNKASNFLNNINLPGFATGTTWFGGGLAWVGERGPELVSLPRGSSVYSTGASALAGNGVGGAGVVEVHSHVWLDGKQVFTSVQRESLRYNKRNGNNGLSLAPG